MRIISIVIEFQATHYCRNASEQKPKPYLASSLCSQSKIPPASRQGRSPNDWKIRYANMLVIGYIKLALPHHFLIDWSQWVFFVSHTFSCQLCRTWYIRSNYVLVLQHPFKHMIVAIRGTKRAPKRAFSFPNPSA